MGPLTRRRALELLAASGAAALAGCEPDPVRGPPRGAVDDRPPDDTGADAVLSMTPLARPWQTEDPFVFCAHHLDAYPPGNAAMGPDATLAGRQLGRDFAGVDGWNMYHGRLVPGFPRHPHRGFETVTVVKTGLLDHSDSMGATARYGEGDVQWLTAGSGILHAEMFPLVRLDDANPLELFQIWLNLPAANKLVDPYFEMLWSPTIPTLDVVDDAGRTTRLTLVAGGYDAERAPSPPPRSYASERSGHVAIWTLSMDPGARFTLPAAAAGVRRSLYFHRGRGLSVGGRPVPGDHVVTTRGESELALVAGPDVNELLVLAGRPIGEPIARHGPFVMNTDQEIRAAYADYRRTGFGGWPWTRDDPIHPRDRDRFARRPDGTIERPG